MSQVEVQTDLTKGQLRKFNSLFKHMAIRNGQPYLPIYYMHGPLLTNSRQSAVNIVQRHSSLVNPFKEGDYLRPQGLYCLLEKLCEENPKKAIGYRAAIVVVSSEIANNPNLVVASLQSATEKQQAVNKTIREIQKDATHCQLSNKKFTKNNPCEIHHIEGESEEPDLADDPNNLIALSRKVHKEYHSWVIKNEEDISQASLKKFAKIFGYRTDFLKTKMSSTSPAMKQMDLLSDQK